MTVHTMCHDPALPLEGITPGLLLNFSASRKCHMTPQQPVAVVADTAVMVCGCHGEDECNDQLIFQQGANGEELGEWVEWRVGGRGRGSRVGGLGGVANTTSMSSPHEVAITSMSSSQEVATTSLSWERVGRSEWGVDGW